MTRFDPPGAGQWRRDEAHVDGVLTGYLDAVLTPAQLAGFAEGFAEVGAMLAGFDVARVAGHVYMRPIIAGAPRLPIWGEKPPAVIPPPGKAPPRLVFKLLFLLHPELRRRRRRAAAVWAQRPWRDVARRWHDELRPAAERARLAHARVDVTALDDAGLAAHLEEVTRAFRELTVMHFRHAPLQAVVVGDFLARATAWTGASAREVLAALRGASPASNAGATETARIARALDGAPALRALVASARPAGEILAALREAPGDVGRATRAYLEVHGLRPFTGLDLDAETLEELPELVVRGLRAALARAAAGDHGDEARAAGHADAFAALRARAPAEHRDELDASYADARTIYGVRDDDVGILLWALGILRRAMLEAGRRLEARGAVHDRVHVLDALPDELVALVRGARGPAADELRARTARRLELDRLDPPVELGHASPPPPPEHFPPAVARMQRAVFAFIAALDGEVKAPPADAARGGVAGVGVSAGVYEGRARVVRGVEDFGRIEAGDVLVAPFTSPSYNVLLPLLGAIVTERGGLLSHAAIVAREYGMPAVVEARGAMARIPDGSLVRIDGATGAVEVIAARAPATRDAARTPGEATEAAPPPSSAATAPATEGRIAALRDARDGAFGGKARALAAAIAAQLPVPDGLALDADLVERVAAGEPAARRRVHEAIARARGPWAVRSSAIGEDSAGASFAGQHATVLGVNEAELFAAIERVHASAHTASARAYRARMGVTGAPRMGVVIQPLLCPDVSGVLFSRDPTAASREGRVIEATWGLGEALVSGIVTPDRYRVGADGRLLERSIGAKDVAIEARPDGGTAEVVVADDRAHAACLDDARLAELAALAARCEQLFGGPQDLEWAIVGDRVHLLQSRPVTTGAARGQEADSMP